MGSPELRYLHIDHNPGIGGGRAIIRGSRIAVSNVAYRHCRGESVDEILEAWPHLTPAQVYDALAYYYDHKYEIDREIERSLDEEHWQTLYPPGKGIRSVP